MTQLRGEWKILIGATLFALIPVGVVLGKDLGVFTLLFGRLLITAILIGTVRSSLTRPFPIHRDFLLLILWSAIMLAAMIFYFLAIRYAGMAISSALLGLQPVLIVLLSSVLLKERISALLFFASAVGVAGILFIVRLEDLSQPKLFLGEVFGLISALLISLNFVFKKKYLDGKNALSLVFYQSVFQLPWLIPFLFIEQNSFTINALWAILILGLFATVLSYGFIYDGMRSVSAQKVGILQSIEYVLPVVLGVLFYGEQPDIFAFVGIILIIFSCILAFLPVKK
ncbi:MAG: DMT family transporter [Bacteroidetes bacterium]|nr:MAG: DMT family transporter [Bacteroidota bacterium]